MALRVGFDVDGVLADFRTAFQSVARQLRDQNFGDNPDPAELDADRLPATDSREAWSVIVGIPNWWTGVRPYDPAQIERLYTLARDLKWEVVFLTQRPETAGDTVQVQTQSWLETHGFSLPSVVTVPGSRGELANSLRLDLVVDDQLVNCVDVISASQAKAMLLSWDLAQTSIHDQAASRGIGVVHTLPQALDIVERASDILPRRRGRPTRLADWFPQDPGFRIQESGVRKTQAES